VPRLDVVESRIRGGEIEKDAESRRNTIGMTTFAGEEAPGITQKESKKKS